MRLYHADDRNRKLSVSVRSMLTITLLDTTSLIRYALRSRQKKTGKQLSPCPGHIGLVSASAPQPRTTKRPTKRVASALRAQSPISDTTEDGCRREPEIYDDGPSVGDQARVGALTTRDLTIRPHMADGQDMHADDDNQSTSSEQWDTCSSSSKEASTDDLRDDTSPSTVSSESRPSARPSVECELSSRRDSPPLSEKNAQELQQSENVDVSEACQIEGFVFEEFSTVPATDTAPDTRIILIS